MLEINPHELDVVGLVHAQGQETAAFGSLRVGVVELEDSNCWLKVPAAQGEGIESSPDDDVLANASGDRLFEEVLRVSASGDYLRCNREQRAQQHVEHEPTQRPRDDDSPPHRTREFQREWIFGNRGRVVQIVQCARRRCGLGCSAGPTFLHHVPLAASRGLTCIGQMLT